MYIIVSIYDNKTYEVLGQSKSIEFDYPDRVKERLLTWLNSYMRGLRSNKNLSLLISSYPEKKELDLFNEQNEIF